MSSEPKAPPTCDDCSRAGVELFEASSGGQVCWRCFELDAADPDELDDSGVALTCDLCSRETDWLSWDGLCEACDDEDERADRLAWSAADDQIDEDQDRRFFDD